MNGMNGGLPIPISLGSGSEVSELVINNSQLVYLIFDHVLYLVELLGL